MRQLLKRLLDLAHGGQAPATASQPGRLKAFPAPLSEEVREVVRYAVMKDGLTYDEAAAVTGVSRRSVARIVKQAREAEVARLMRAVADRLAGR